MVSPEFWFELSIEAMIENDDLKGLWASPQEGEKRRGGVWMRSNEDISGVWVTVNKTILEDHLSKDLCHFVGECSGINAVVFDSFEVANENPINELHREDFVRGQRLLVSWSCQKPS